MGLFNFGKTKEEIEEIKKAKADEKQAKKDALNAEIQENKERLAAFKQDRVIENALIIDLEHGWFKLKGFMTGGVVFNLADINDFEVIENGETVTSGGLGRAAVGALAFGGTGAIVGAITGKKKTKSIIENLKIKINMNDLDAPVIYINLITTKTKTSSLTYKMGIKQADSIVSSLDVLVKQYQNIAPAEPVVSSTTDEIRKFKALLDDGIINQDEFDAKKAELLNL